MVKYGIPFHEIKCSTKPFSIGKTTLTVLPRLSHQSIGYPKWYKIQSLLDSWTLMLLARIRMDDDILEFDLIEVTRESLDAMIDQQYLRVSGFYIFKKTKKNHFLTCLQKKIENCQKKFKIRQHRIHPEKI